MEDIEKKQIIYDLIQKEIEKIQGEIELIRKEVKKERKFLIQFQDGTQVTVSGDDLEIVSNPVLIAKMLKRTNE